MYIPQFLFFNPSKNLHLPHQGSNPCLLCSHHAALSTTPIGPPLPLTPTRRGHMYINQFLFFHPNKNLHLPHQGSNLCFLLSHHAALSITPIEPPLHLNPKEEGHVYLMQFLFILPIKNLHLPHQGSNPCLLCSHHAALSTTPIAPPLPFTPRGRGRMYINQFLFLNPNKNLHLPHQGSNPCLLLSHHAALSTIPIGPPLHLNPKEEGHVYHMQFLFILPNKNLHLPHQGSNPCLLCSPTLPYQLHQSDLPSPLPRRGDVMCTLLTLFILILTKIYTSPTRDRTRASSSAPTTLPYQLHQTALPSLLPQGGEVICTLVNFYYFILTLIYTSLTWDRTRASSAPTTLPYELHQSDRPSPLSQGGEVIRTQFPPLPPRSLINYTNRPTPPIYPKGERSYVH